MAKIVGKRIDLDQLETLLATDQTPCALATSSAGGNAELGSEPWINVAWPGEWTEDDCLNLGRKISRQLGLPATAVSVHTVLDIPTLHNGKTDYRAIADWPHTAQAPADEVSSKDLPDETAGHTHPTRPGGSAAACLS